MRNRWKEKGGCNTEGGQAGHDGDVGRRWGLRRSPARGTTPVARNGRSTGTFRNIEQIAPCADQVAFTSNYCCSIVGPIDKRGP